MATKNEGPTPILLRNMENPPLYVDYVVDGKTKTLRLPSSEAGRDKASIRLDAADAAAVLASPTVQGWISQGRVERYAA